MIDRAVQVDPALLTVLPFDSWKTKRRFQMKIRMYRGACHRAAKGRTPSAMGVTEPGTLDSWGAARSVHELCGR